MQARREDRLHDSNTQPCAALRVFSCHTFVERQAGCWPLPAAPPATDLNPCCCCCCWCVCVCTADKTIPVEDGRKFAAVLPGHRIVEVEGADHNFTGAVHYRGCNP